MDIDALFAHSQQDALKTKAKVAPTLSVENGVGVLSFEAITMTTFEMGKKLPGQARWDGKSLRFPVTKEALSYVKVKWPDVIVLQPAIKRPIAEPVEAPPIDQRGLFWRRRFPPFAHQATAFKLGAHQDEFAYLMDMGTGKTKAGIDDAAHNFAIGAIDRVLVIAPNGVHEQWIETALPQHWPLELPCVRHAIVTGDTYQKDRKTVKRRPAWMTEGADGNCKWLAVNIENLKVREVRNGGVKSYLLEGLSEECADFLSAGRGMIILDESHKIKNSKANRTKALWKLGRLAKKRRILTGTPVAIGLEDYYAQFRFLNPNIIGVWSMTGFKQQFCVMGGFNNEQVTGYRDTEEFHRRIGAVSYRVEKADVLDLPPKMFMERTCELSPIQRRVFNELKRELMTELTDGTTLTVDEVTQRMLRLQQVTQGFLPREGGDFDEYPDNRLQTLLDIIEPASGRIVIWCRFRRDIDRLMAHFGSAAIRYDGSNKDQRPADRAEWVRPGSSKRFFIGNAQAGGTGLDWINGAGTVIYYSNSFSSLDRWQSEDRTHRIGTVGTVSYYDIICKGTIDRAILANLKRKRDVSDMSLTELRAMLEDG